MAQGGLTPPSNQDPISPRGRRRDRRKGRKDHFTGPTMPETPLRSSMIRFGELFPAPAAYNPKRKQTVWDGETYKTIEVYRSWESHLARTADAVDQCGKFYRDGYDDAGVVDGYKRVYTCGIGGLCPRCGKRRANKQRATYGPKVRQMDGDVWHIVFTVEACAVPEDLGPLLELLQTAWGICWDKLQNLRVYTDGGAGSGRKRLRATRGCSYIAALEVGHKTESINPHLHVLLHLPGARPKWFVLWCLLLGMWRTSLRKALSKKSRWAPTIADGLSGEWYRAVANVKANGGVHVRKRPLRADKGLGEQLKSLLDYNLNGIAKNRKAYEQAILFWWAMTGRRRVSTGGEIRHVQIDDDPEVEIEAGPTSVDGKDVQKSERKPQWWGPLRWRGAGPTMAEALRRADHIIDFSDRAFTDEPIVPFERHELPWKANPT